MKKILLRIFVLGLYVSPIILLWDDIPYILVSSSHYLSGMAGLIFWFCLVYASIYFSTSVYLRYEDKIKNSRLILGALSIHLFSMLIILPGFLLEVFCYFTRCDDVGVSMISAFLKFFGFFATISLYIIGFFLLIIYKLKNHRKDKLANLDV